MAEPETVEKVAEAGGIVAGGIASSFGFVFVVRFFMNSSMNTLLGAIKVL